MTFALHSPAFQNGGAIPARYARFGQNLSPPLRWSDPPPAAKSFMLVVQDPDAPSGTFWHWAIYDIDPDRRDLREGAGGPSGTLPQAVNGFGNARYDGPAPPPGHGPHHYHFKIAALDAPQLDLPEGIGAERAWNAAQLHMIEEAELIGTFER